MGDPVSSISVEAGRELVVSFALDEHAGKSLALLRTPKHEVTLPDEERGVSVGAALQDCVEPELLVSVDWAPTVVYLATTFRRYTLDVGSVDEREVRQAKAVLRKMNFDRRFKTKGL